MTAKYKVAYLVSHPIQYQAPLLRFIAGCPEIDLTVFFLSDFSVREYNDTGFGAKIQWDVPLLEGYKHVFLPTLGKPRCLSSLHPLVYGLTRHLRTGGFDALWMHGYAHQANLRAMLIAKRLGMKVFVRAESQMGSALRNTTTKTFKEAMLRLLFARVDAFLAIGTLNRQYYQHYGVPDNKLFSMPYAVDNAFFQSQALAAAPQAHALRRELQLEAGRPVILYASKFVARKRADDLLEAYIQLSANGVSEPHPYLIFVGDGEQRFELEQRAHQTGWNSIRFVGFKNQTELPAYFVLCDVFVLVSEREPWGLIVNEVMNAGRPVIVSNEVGAGKDLVYDGENGYIVPTGNRDALRDRLLQITSNPDTAAQMGRASLLRIDNWSFKEDYTGLLDALKCSLG